MGKNQKKNFFFDFWHQNDSIREKKAKKNVELFDPKNSITPAGVTPNGQKSKHFFFHFWHQNDSIRKNKQKKLTQNLVLECLECLECGPNKGQNVISGGSVRHHLNCLAKSFLNMKFQPKMFTRSRENGEKPHFWA